MIKDSSSFSQNHVIVLVVFLFVLSCFVFWCVYVLMCSVMCVGSLVVSVHALCTIMGSRAEWQPPSSISTLHLGTELSLGWGLLLPRLAWLSSQRWGPSCLQHLAPGLPASAALPGCLCSTGDLNAGTHFSLLSHLQRFQLTLMTLEL